MGSRITTSPDDLEEMSRTLLEAEPENFDVILISGGSGGGTYDFGMQLFLALGATIHFRAVNVRPGKPLIFGTTPNQLIFGLPGNALSHYVCFHLFVRRALEGLMGRAESTTQKCFSGRSPWLDTNNARESWFPAQVILREGRLECRALAWKSSGDITRLPSANALIRVPASTSQLEAGSLVEILFTRSMSF